MGRRPQRGHWEPGWGKRGWLWTAFTCQEISAITQKAETRCQAGHNYKMYYSGYSKGRCDIYVEPRKMVQMNRFRGQKQRHRCREEMFGHQGGKVAGVVVVG